MTIDSNSFSGRKYFTVVNFFFNRTTTKPIDNAA